MKKNKLEYKNFEIKSENINYNEEKKELEIKAYASIFDVEDELGLSWNPEIDRWVEAKDIIHKGAFKKSIEERKARIKFCKNHDMDDPVGTPLDLYEDETGLFTESKFSAAEQKLQTKVREGIFNEMSIGYVVTKVSFEKKDDGTLIRHIWEVKLYEYSIVTLGRQDMAKVTELKSAQFVEDIITSLIKEEKNEEKRYKLMQIKSLIDGEPRESLIQKEPIKQESKSIFANIEFVTQNN